MQLRGRAGPFRGDLKELETCLALVELVQGILRTAFWIRALRTLDGRVPKRQRDSWAVQWVWRGRRSDQKGSHLGNDAVI